MINVPSGNCTWTSSLSVAVGISIIGAGSVSTIIQDSLNGTLFQVSIPSATSSLFRLSGMTIQPAAGQGGQPSVGSISGTCNSSTCSNIRLDNLTLPWPGTGFMFYIDNVFGVIDHNNVTANGGYEFVGIGQSSYGGVGCCGDNSWRSQIPWHG